MLPFVLCLNKVSGQEKGISLTRNSEILFSDIILPGKKHVFIQKCAPQVDSIVANGQMNFAHAVLRDVGDCSISYVFKDTILKSCEVFSESKKFKSAIDNFVSTLVNKQSPFIHSDISKKTLRVWFFERDSNRYMLHLSTTGRETRMVISPDTK